MLERSIRGPLIKCATTTNKIVLTVFHTKHIIYIIRIVFEHMYESLDQTRHLYLIEPKLYYDRISL